MAGSQTVLFIQNIFWTCWEHTNCSISHSVEVRHRQAHETLRFNSRIPATINNSIVQGLTGPKSDIPVPSVVDQVDSFLSTSFNETEPCSTLAILVAGVNDAIFGGPALNVRALTDGLVNSVKLLTTKGANAAK